MIDPASRDDTDEAELLGDVWVRMARCWEAVRAETLRSGLPDEPQTRRDAIRHHLEAWLQRDGEDSRLLDGWRRLDQATRDRFLNFFADPPPFDIIGFTCDRCGAFDPQRFDPDRQVCSVCGWVWVRPKGP